MKNYLKRWGLKFWKLEVTWYDLWDDKICLEVVWNGKIIIQ